MEHNNIPDDPVANLDMRSRQQQIEQSNQEAEAAKKNHDFVQLDRNSSDALAIVGYKCGLALPIFIIMTKRMRWDNTVAISREALAHTFGVGKATVSNAIKVLVEHQIISIRKVGTSNEYHINASVAWSTHANLKHKAGFRRTVPLDPEYAARIKELDKNTIAMYTVRKADQ